jgi:hypothetical protein
MKEDRSHTVTPRMTVSQILEVSEAKIWYVHPG